MMPRMATHYVKKPNNIISLFFVLLTFLSQSHADQDIQDAFFLVSKPKIYLRKGPNPRYPIRFSLTQNTRVRLLERRHLWVEVLTKDGKQGWVESDQIAPLPHNGDELLPVFPPKPTKPNILDSEHWELGIFTGHIDMDEFDSHQIFGLTGNYHFNEWAYLRTHIGTTSIDQPDALRQDSNPANDNALQSNSEKRFAYSFISLGTYLFNTQPYITPNTVWKGHFSTDLGLGATLLNSDVFLTYRAGIGYHLFPLDWLSISLNTSIMRFTHDIFADRRAANSSEITFGLQLYL